MGLQRRRVLTLALAPVVALALCRVAGAQAPTAPPEVAAELPAARRMGSGTLRFLGLRIYDATLWLGAAPLGADWAASPLALELAYARGLDGAKIAERSLSEMRRQGEIRADLAERWLGAMKQLFPDVKAGDRITGFNVPGQGVRFFVNGQPKGELRDTDFARYFFGIWLSPKTSEPALRNSLLGAPP